MSRPSNGFAVPEPPPAVYLSECLRRNLLKEKSWGLLSHLSPRQRRFHIVHGNDIFSG